MFGIIKYKQEKAEIRRTTLTCAQKLTSSQLNLSHGIKRKRVVKKLKTKNGDAQKKRSGRKVRGVSPEARSLWWERFVKEVDLETGVN